MPVMTVTATPIPSRYLLWRLQREWEQLARAAGPAGSPPTPRADYRPS